MKKIGKHGVSFPTEGDEFSSWVPLTTTVIIHPFILCAAQARVEGAWSAYCAPVAGQDTKADSAEVLRNGTKLTRTVAVALFPMFEGVPYAP